MKKFAIFFILFSFSISYASAQEAEKKEMKPALLIIDVQNKFLPMMSEEDQELALEMMNWSIWVFRKFDLPVIRIYHTDEEYGVVEGMPEFEFPEELKITDEDPKIVKTYPSAFVKTGLDDLLKEKGVNTLFLCGLSSVGCVLATYIEAASHDYKAFMIKDAMLSHSTDYTNSIEEIFNAMDLETVLYMIEISR